MAPITRSRRPPPDDEARTDSDSDGGAAAPPKKPKFAPPKHAAGSSPSASEETAKGKRNRYKVFGDDDEITLLTRLAEFWANGKNNKWTELHLFVKDDLRKKFTKLQVSEKIRSFKKKFEANRERHRTNGGRIDLSDPHESAVFELSKALWGDEEIEKGDNISEEKEKEEKDEGSEAKMKTKKRKQESESGEENEKSKKPEHGVEELVEDENWSILRLRKVRKVVDENGEGSKNGKKSKEVDECVELLKFIFFTQALMGNLRSVS